jgi:hypothetical protein
VAHAWDEVVLGQRKAAAAAQFAGGVRLRHS